MTRSCPRCARLYAGDQQFCPHDGAALAEVATTDPRLGAMMAGRFHIQELMGAGGMGRIYRAEQLPIGRMVAVKVLKHDRLDDAEAGKRFLREAKAISRLKSPHTVTLYDYGERDDGVGELFLVMEHLVGQTLRDRLRSAGRLSVSESLTITDHIARSLAEAHDVGIVHRDLKPANIFLVEVPTYPIFVKVLDFGVATLEPGAEDQTKLTTTSQLPGTPAYLAPERVQGEEAAPAADIYALGVMLYEMITGVRPFTGATPADLFKAAIQTDPRPLEQACPGLQVPPAVGDLVSRCLAKSPRLRPRDGQSLCADLAGVLAAVVAEVEGAPTGLAVTLTSPGARPPADAFGQGAGGLGPGAPRPAAAFGEEAGGLGPSTAANTLSSLAPGPPPAAAPAIGWSARARWPSRTLVLAGVIAVAGGLGYLAGQAPAAPSSAAARLVVPPAAPAPLVPVAAAVAPSPMPATPPPSAAATAHDAGAGQPDVAAPPASAAPLVPVAAAVAPGPSPAAPPPSAAASVRDAGASEPDATAPWVDGAATAAQGPLPSAPDSGAAAGSGASDAGPAAPPPRLHQPVKVARPHRPPATKPGLSEDEAKRVDLLLK